MDVVLVRHGIAEDRERAAELGVRDARRGLTDEGRSKMKRAARGLARLVPSGGALWTSPLLRAVQTAEIVGSALDLPATETRALLPGAAPEELLRELTAHPSLSRVIAVGHEPHLTLFMSLSLGAASSPFVMKKGGACLLRFAGAPRPGGAMLLWLATSGMLRRTES